MVFINLDTIEKAIKLTGVCEKYKSIDIDILYGRYIIDGRSILGVSSLLGNIIKIYPNTDDNEMIDSITKDLEKIGAWKETK